MLTVNNTPVELYGYKKYEYWVKREDLACNKPGPPFAKIRGLELHLRRLKELGVETVGYMDTAISMAGWGISFICQEIGLRAVIYYPSYKSGLRYNQAQFMPLWRRFGATTVPITPPTRLQINIHKAKRQFKNDYPQGVWLEYGLKLMDTVGAIERESELTFKEITPRSVVCSVGSGVMLSGIVRCIVNQKINVHHIYGILVNSSVNANKKLEDIYRYADMYNDFFSPFNFSMHLVNGGYRYEDKAKAHAPFPCNEYYDLKAYEWMIKNIRILEKPILFWNIGG